MRQWYEVYFDLEHVKGHGLHATYANAGNHEIINAETGQWPPLFGINENLRRASLKLDIDGILGDRLATIGNRDWLVLSPPAQAATRGMKICPSIRWVPLDVLSTKGKVLAEYQWAYGAKAHGVWDLERSNCLWVDGEKGEGKKLATILYPVLLARNVPSYDLFYADSLRWVCTTEFKHAIEEVCLTGFRFGILEV